MNSRVVTQEQVARDVGFNRTTVSAILNNRAGMKFRSETRQRILDAANRLGYRPHRYAQVMRKGKSGTIAVLQMGGRLHVNDLRAQLVARAIHQHGYHLSSHHVLWHNEGVQEALDAVLDARAEGLILVGAGEILPSKSLKHIRDANMALVSVSGIRFPGVPQVRSDFRQCMFELTNHLLGLGHRRLVLLASWMSEVKDEDHCWPVQERIDGFQEAIAKVGSDAVRGEVVCEEGEVQVEVPSMKLGKVSMQKLLQRPNRPDAVLCTNDGWAFGALAACAEAGVRVPQDIAITGIDNEPMGEFTYPPLTTSAQPTDAIASKAVEILSKQVRGEKLSASEELVKMPCELVVRQSCGAAKAEKVN